MSQTVARHQNKFSHNVKLNRYWLYGLHPVSAALTNKNRKKHCLLGTKNAIQKLAEPIRIAGIQPEPVGAKVITRLLETDAVHQGVALEVSPLDLLTVADLMLRHQKNGPLVLLDEITDSQNVGAIMRTTEAFFGQGVITSYRNSPKESGALAKASSGALERVPLVKIPNLIAAMKTLKENGYWLVGLDVHGPITLEQILFDIQPVQTGFVFGAEGKGLRSSTKACCDFLAGIPINSSTGSLNVSNAAAICLYAATMPRS